MATSSTNMLMPIPVVGVDDGPQWATYLNDCLNIIDVHDHSPGKGVQITPNGLDINADLAFGVNNATQLRTVRFSAQSAALALASDLTCIYAVAADLYYNDGQGNQIQITANGAVAGTPGSIANLASPASASYVSASGTFVFQSDVNVAANLDGRSIKLRKSTTSSPALTLSPPTAMSGNYSIVLPTLPASTKILSIDSSGNMSAVYGVDGATLVISSNNLKVADAGIGTTQLADQSVTAAKIVDATITTTQISASAGILGSQLSASAGIVGGQLANLTITAGKIAADAITTAKILDANVTQAKLGTANYVVSSGCNTYSIVGSPTDVTNMTGTLTTHGRPVICYIQGVLTSTGAGFTSIGPTTNLYLLRSANGGGSYTTRTQWSSLVNPTPATFFFFEAVAAGTYNWKVQASGSGTITDVCLVVAEM